MKLRGPHRARFVGIGVVLILLLGAAIVLLRDKSQNEFAPIDIDETKTIVLEKSSAIKQLTIFENDRVIISIGYDQFLSYGKSDAKLPLFSHTVESRSDEIESFFETGVIPEGFSAQGALIVEMLNAGQAHVYDKQSDTEVTSIVEHYQNFICGPLCGGGSIDFYFHDGTVLYNGPVWKY